MNILYEDNHLLVVEKPVNMPVQADASGDTDLMTALKAYIKEKYHKPGDVYLGLVHRLDRPVGGVMVFARTSKAAQRLTAQFKQHRAVKRYVAVTLGSPQAQAALTDYLVKDEQSHSSHVAAPDVPGAKEARLSYRTLCRGERDSLLDIALYTGRPHQIRVQLAHAGLPIVGDMRYGTGAAGTQIRLWAYALTVYHPTQNEPMTFFSVPDWPDYDVQRKLLPMFRVCSGLYEDDDLLAVDKNAGAEVEEQLLGELSTLYDTLYPVHRLDANTEGVVVFARNERTRDRLLDAFYRHETKKRYHAVVLGTTTPSGRLVHYAVKDEAQGVMRLCGEHDAGALRMELAYRTVQTGGGWSKVEIDLLTGRTHQIRLQMAAIGHPVLGDDKYGDRAANKAFHVRRQLLLAKRLTVLGKTLESPRELATETLP